MRLTYGRASFFLLDPSALAERPREFLLDFIKVIVTAIVRLASVVECQASPTRSVRRNAGRASGGALDRRLTVKQENKHPILSLFYIE
jgi:hypothetical protein